MNSLKSERKLGFGVLLPKKKKKKERKKEKTDLYTISTFELKKSDK